MTHITRTVLLSAGVAGIALAYAGAAEVREVPKDAAEAVSGTVSRSALTARTGGVAKATAVNPASGGFQGIISYDSESVPASSLGIRTDITHSPAKSEPGAVLPWSNSFTSAESMESMTVINANGDDRTWEWYSSGYAGCKWNSELAMDDWLITPGFNVEANAEIKVSLLVKGESTRYPERFEVMCGTEPTASAMTLLVVAPTVINQTSFAEYSGTVTAAEAGTYYIGVHGISDADCYTLYVDDISVSLGIPAGAPSAVENLKVTPGAGGAKSATVSFVAPMLSHCGIELEESSTVEIYCGGTLLETVEDMEAGLNFSNTYDNLPAGTQTFMVVASNSAGRGDAASADAFIGFDLPVAPHAVTAVETDTPGYVHLEWEPVAYDVRGTAFGNGDVTYIVAYNYNGQWRIIEQGVTACEYDYRAMADGKQDLMQYCVYAMSEAGLGDGTRTLPIAVGTPYTLPYTESFPGAETDKICGSTIISGSSHWYLAEDGTYFQDVFSQDGDGGLAYHQAVNYGDEAALYSGKIALTGSPVLSFWYFTLGEDDDNEIAVKVKAGGDMHDVATVPQTGNTGEWRRALVPLSAFSGQTIQLYLHACVRSKVFTIIDNIRIDEMPEHSLSISSIRVPAQVNAGMEVPVVVSLLNGGSNAAEGYAVEVTCDGNSVAVLNENPSIEPFGEHELTFSGLHNVYNLGTHVYSAKLTYDADASADGKQSEEKSVEVLAVDFPTVEIAGEACDNDIARISWNIPELGDQGAHLVTEDFEDPEYESFTTTDFGMWKLFNYNDGNTWPYDDKTWTFPGSGTCFGFILMDPAEAGLPAECAGYNGSPEPDNGSGRCLQAFAHRNTAGNSAWLVSPELTGEAQEITFMARSVDPASYNPEELVVGYSDGSTDPNDFYVAPLVPGNEAPLEWTQFKAQLPEGSKRFSIGSVSNQRYVLIIDDITFTGYMNPYAGLEVEGFNVYRDGKPLGVAGDIDEEYSDAADGQIHSYAVTVKYNQGESMPSNVVEVKTASLAGLTYDDVKVWSESGRIVVAGAGGLDITVSGADGVLVTRVAGSARNELEVAAGVYIVKAGTHTAKLIVR